MGTVGYMSPEQVKGKAADERSDIFSFGAILYEMLSGRRAFQADSAAETMAAILKEEPPDLSVTNQNISPRPRADRAALPREESRGAIPIAPRHRLRPRVALRAPGGQRVLGFGRRPPATDSLEAAAAGLALLAAGLLAGAWFAGGDRSFPTFKRLTFRRGFISNARFAPDGQTILYSADWDGGPSRIFSSVRKAGNRWRSLSRPPRFWQFRHAEKWPSFSTRWSTTTSTSAGGRSRWSRSRADPRARSCATSGLADWGPDGKDLAVVRQAGARQRLEYPPGKLVHESTAWIVTPRVSPRGDRFAFFEGRPSTAIR